MGQRPNHPYMTPQPKKVQQLRGQMSVTPLPKRRQSGEKRYAVTPGVGQRLNISRAQQLMQGYQSASKPTPGRKVSVASNPHVTPSRSRASASADLDPAARATALIPKTPSPEVDSGADTPDDEFYEVSTDFDFKHDTPAKAYRRSVREKHPLSPASAQKKSVLFTELNRIKARLTLGDVQGAHRLCTNIFETRQHEIFRCAEYYVVAASVSAHMHNFPKAISLYSSAIRVLAEPAEALRRGLEQLQASAPTQDIKSEIRVLASRVCSTATPPRPVSQSDRLKAFRQRTQEHLGNSPARSSSGTADVDQIKLFTTLMASSVERQRVIDRMSTSMPRAAAPDIKPARRFDFSAVADAPGAKKDSAKPDHAASSSKQLEAVPEQITEAPVLEPATPPCKGVVGVVLKKSSKLVSSPFFKNTQPGRVPMEDAPEAPVPVTRPVPAPVTASRTLEFGTQQPSMTVAGYSRDGEWCEDSRRDTSPARQVQTPTRPQAELKSWIQEHQDQDSLGRFETLTVVRSKKSKKSAAAEVSSPNMVPIEMNGEIQLVLEMPSGGVAAEDINIMTPVRRSARLNKDTPSAAKPKVLVFRTNPNIKQ